MVRLTYLYVPAPDLRATVTFYRDVLGLEEAWREGEGTVAFWAPDRKVQLMVATTDQPAGPMYLVDDAGAWAAANDQVPVRVPSCPIPGGAVTGFEDPSGNVFYVYDQSTEIDADARWTLRSPARRRAQHQPSRTVASASAAPSSGRNSK